MNTPQRSSKVRDRTILQVRARPGKYHNAVLKIGTRLFPCALGRSGMAASKREGDGATPVGCWPLRYVLYRADRIARPRTSLPLKIIGRYDGWCDDAGDRNYNRPVRLPYLASTETLWREDPLYDLIVVLGHNDIPRARGRGSAIFMHLEKENLAPTQGCIALSQHDLLQVLQYCGPASLLVVTA